MKDVICISDLVSDKYNNGEAHALGALKNVIEAVKHGARASLIIPASLLRFVPVDWKKEPQGKAYQEQGIDEEIYFALRL